MNGVSTLELLMRMTVSLLVIGSLLWLAQSVGRKKFGSLGRSASAPIEIESRKQLTKASSVALVRAGDRHLLIGITDSGVSLIAEGEDLATPHQLEPAAVPIELSSSTSLVKTSLVKTALVSTSLVGTSLDSSPANTDNTNTDNILNQIQLGSNSELATARKPWHRANSSTPSWTSALDALREMTIRRI